ncbi:MAG: LD-carboxypeptidase [Candidatus Omnitrophota bacterium]
MKKQNAPRSKPARLNYADTIGIVAPASSFDAENFRKGVKMLRKTGNKVKYERSIFNKCWSQPGHDKQRAAQINRMFADKEVKAIFCAKAGYGAADIIPYLDKKIIRQNPKIFVGYSDITTLLLYLQKEAEIVVFHGPVVSGEMYEGMNPLTLEYLKKLITSPAPFGEISFPQLKVIRPGKAKGVLAGGNLSLIVDSLGKSYEIDTADKVLFLEDVGENTEDIRGYFIKLKQADKFKTIKALMFGRMLDCFDEQSGLLDILDEFFPGSDIPIISRFPAGHIKTAEELNFTLPLGVEISIDTNIPLLEITESAVK